MPEDQITIDILSPLRNGLNDIVLDLILDSKFNIFESEGGAGDSKIYCYVDKQDHEGHHYSLNCVIIIPEKWEDFFINLNEEELEILNNLDEVPNPIEIHIRKQEWEGTYWIEMDSSLVQFNTSKQLKEFLDTL